MKICVGEGPSVGQCAGGGGGACGVHDMSWYEACSEKGHWMAGNVASERKSWLTRLGMRCRDAVLMAVG
eukprot:362077-Chlamydomonas_euryale.AAC.18